MEQRWTGFRGIGVQHFVVEVDLSEVKTACGLNLSLRKAHKDEGKYPVMKCWKCKKTLQMQEAA